MKVKELMALYLLYGIVNITRRFKLTELLVLLQQVLHLTFIGGNFDRCIHA